MIYLLTPTGNRQAGILFLAEYIKDQDYTGPMKWIIVDDCDPRTMIPKMPIEVEVIRPEWRWSGENTQSKSMLAGLAAIPENAQVIVMEDDDVYHPNHVSNLVRSLKNFDLVGERDTRYYNVATRRHRIMPTTRHSSLCSVGVKGAALESLRIVCEISKIGIDSRLWMIFKGKKKLLETSNVVGIKGMPGREGIGVGHRATFGSPDWEMKLVDWIGEKQALKYNQFREM